MSMKTVKVFHCLQGQRNGSNQELLNVVFFFLIVLTATVSAQHIKKHKK